MPSEQRHDQPVATVEQERIDAARSRISRVNARLHLLDRTPDEPDFPTELRLLREALDLLDAEVKLA